MALSYALPVTLTMAVGVTQLEGRLIWIEVDQTSGTCSSTVFATGEDVSAGDARTARCVWPFGVVACGRGVVSVDWRDGTPQCMTLGCGTTEASLRLPGKEVFSTTSILYHTVFVATDHGLALVDLEARTVLGCLELELSARQVPCRIISPRRAVSLRNGCCLVAVDTTADVGSMTKLRCHELAAHASSLSSILDCGHSTIGGDESNAVPGSAPNGLFCTISDIDGFLTSWHWPNHVTLPARLWRLAISDVFPEWQALQLSEAVVVAHPPSHVWLYSLESGCAARLHVPTLHSEAMAVEAREKRVSKRESSQAGLDKLAVAVHTASGIEVFRHPHCGGIASIQPVCASRALVTDITGQSLLVEGVRPLLSHEEAARSALCVLGDWILPKQGDTLPAPWLEAWIRRKQFVLWRSAVQW